MSKFVYISDLEALASYPIFADLSKEELKKLLTVCREESFLPNAVLHTQGEPAEYIYVILSGRVEEELRSKDVLLSPIHPLEAGDVTGCSALFPPNLHTCTARAVTETSVLVFNADKLRKLFDEDCGIARSFLKHIVGSLHHRIRTLELVSRPG
jgi:CRP-like cAMP-binding protein